MQSPLSGRPSGGPTRPRRRAPHRVAALVLLAAATGLASTPLVAEVDPCPANLEQSSPCGVRNTAGDSGSAPPPSLPSVTLGNPLSLVTGAKRQTETDFDLDGGGLSFRRHYDSSGADTDVGLGPGWRHEYSVALFARPDGGLEIVESSGRRVLFERVPGDPSRILYRPHLASDGRLVGEGDEHAWHLPDGRTLRFKGSFLVRVERSAATSGAPRFLSMYYRARRLVRVTDEAGRVLHLEYGTAALRDFDGARAQPLANHLAAVVLPDERRVVYGYDVRGNLAEARFEDGTARAYHYEDPLHPHHLTGLVERTGVRFATWTYDERGRAISSEHADGVERVTLAHDAPLDRGEAVGATGTTTVTDSLGATSVYTWRRHPTSGTSLLLSATGPGCASCPPTGRRYAYTDDARLESETRLGNDGAVLAERRYTWTADGRLAAVHESGEDGIERLLERREYASDIERPVLVARPSVNGAGERTVDTTFDEDGLVVAITERGYAPADSLTAFALIERTTRFGYTDGRLTTIDGPRDDVADVTRLERDALGQLVAIHPPAAPAIRIIERDALGRAAAFRLGTGSPWRVDRNARGDVTRLAHRELVVRYAHDAEGRATAITDTDGRTLSLEHDAAGRPARMIDDLGRVTRWLTDTEGKVTGRTLYGTDSALLQSIKRLHDIGDPASVENFTAGAHGTIERDPLARLAIQADGFGARTILEIDPFGRSRALTDARANRTEMWHDDFGRLVRLDSPDTGVTEHAHDAAGNVVRRTDASGAVTTYAWDAANRLVRRESDDGTTTFVYGDTASGGAHGRLVEARNATTTERFDYDAEGQLVTHTREIDGHSFITGYTHDERGRLVDKYLPDGQTLRHHYHENGPDRGRLRAITRARWFGLASETLVAEIDLDVRDGTAGHVSHGGLATRRRHAPNGEIASVEIGRALRLDYRLDATGRIVGIEENGRSRRYDYTRGRLAHASTATGVYTYRHDAVGNRLERTVEDENGMRRERYRYGEAGRGNRLLAVVDESSSRERVHAYGGDGAPRRIGELVYTHDAERRPVAVHRDGRLLARYAYNAFGERVRKTVYPSGANAESTGAEPVTTYFLHDGSTLVAEADKTGRVTAQYVYLDGHRAVAKLEGRHAYAIHGDHLGTPLMMTDADGAVVWRAVHAPFGKARIDVEKVRLDLRLPGQYADAETGMHHNRFRDYDPETGRYLTADPIGLAGGVNAYAYVDADPLTATDPLGLLEWSTTALNDAEIQRQARRIGLTTPFDEIRQPPRPPGTVAKPAARVVARAVPYLSLFALAYEAGYTGARILDELVFQPDDQAALIAAIKIYRPRYVNPYGDPSRQTLAALAEALREEQIGYLDDIGGACPADRELYNETVRAVEGADGLIERLAAPEPYRSPEGILFPSRTAYLVALNDYEAAGGERTGKSFRDWWAERLGGAAADSTVLSENAWVYVNVRDPAADVMAEKLGGVSSIKFPGRFDDAEFDILTDNYLGQTKPGGIGVGSGLRKQIKRTIEAAQELGLTPYFHFNGPPRPDVIRKIEEYGRRYGIVPIIDLTPI